MAEALIETWLGQGVLGLLESLFIQDACSSARHSVCEWLKASRVVSVFQQPITLTVL